METKKFEGTREEWMLDVISELRPIFEEKGFPIPEKIRASCGWTSGRKTIGECWYPTASEDGTSEIFISPAKADSYDVSQILVHEVIHSAVGASEGHKGNFKVLAKKLNLGGKMTATTRTEEFDKWMSPIIQKIGLFPHATLNRGASTRPKKQSTRLIKCECACCGYTIRTTQKWLDIGVPHCPVHGKMEVC